MLRRAPVPTQLSHREGEPRYLLLPCPPAAPAARPSPGSCAAAPGSAPPPSPEPDSGPPAGRPRAAAQPCSARPCPHSVHPAWSSAPTRSVNTRRVSGLPDACLPYPHLNSQTVARGPRDWGGGTESQARARSRFPSVPWCWSQLHPKPRYSQSLRMEPSVFQAPLGFSGAVQFRCRGLDGILPALTSSCVTSEKWVAAFVFPFPHQ